MVWEKEEKKARAVRFPPGAVPLSYSQGAGKRPSPFRQDSEVESTLEESLSRCKKSKGIFYLAGNGNVRFGKRGVARDTRRRDPEQSVTSQGPEGGTS